MWDWTGKWTELLCVSYGFITTVTSIILHTNKPIYIIEGSY